MKEPPYKYSFKPKRNLLPEIQSIYLPKKQKKEVKELNHQPIRVKSVEPQTRIKIKELRNLEGAYPTKKFVENPVVVKKWPLNRDEELFIRARANRQHGMQSEHLAQAALDIVHSRT
ncbi:hypothetical protein HK103_005271 [Boothiomyces macroporosus]|uniref:Uncharacterized protein n=1 Tax=Boothiomyces macroporosus TaxID=261099 RepID=A0AAD5UG19_9FUNG|nr:hypothetical protein HK103_005251 [Boothiomyces macroporosus]KAJ3256637.1 hypothetical protein HK103_005271 [Boothiomyces macroporosus]